MAEINMDMSKHASQALTLCMTRLDLDAIRNEGRSTDVLRQLVEQAQKCKTPATGPIPLPLGNMQKIADQRRDECAGCEWHPDVCRNYCMRGLE